MKINKQAKREAKQLFRFCLVNGLVDENRVRNVVQDVIAAGRRDCPAILSHFKRLVRLEIAGRTATVESAAPLPPDLRAGIEAGLTRRYGPGLTAVFTHRPALVGGVGTHGGPGSYVGARGGAVVGAEVEQSF